MKPISSFFYFLIITIGLFFIGFGLFEGPGKVVKEVWASDEDSKILMTIVMLGMFWGPIIGCSLILVYGTGIIDKVLGAIGKIFK